MTRPKLLEAAEVIFEDTRQQGSAQQAPLHSSAGGAAAAYEVLAAALALGGSRTEPVGRQVSMKLCYVLC